MQYSCHTYDMEKKHKLFFGKNALWFAAYYSSFGREAKTSSMLYNFTPRFVNVCAYNPNDKFCKTVVDGEFVNGDGVHAKMYTLRNGDAILSSQNNGPTGWVEFAILYQSGKVSKTINNLIKVAKYELSQFKSSQSKLSIGGKR